MTVLITSDWHFSDNPRDEARWHFAEKTLPVLLKQHKVKLLLNLGDLCEQKYGYSAELVNRVVAVFDRLTAICPIIFLRGNHDWYDRPDNPFFAFLAKFPLGRLQSGESRVAWVNTPTPLKALSPSFSPTSRAVLLPHSADFERDWGEVEFAEYDIVFAHQCFTGAVSDSGFRLSGVPLSYFPSQLKIVSGDIHRPQTVGNLTYVGAPTSIDFGDEIEPRVLLWQGGTTFDSIPIGGSRKRLVLMRFADLVGERKLTLLSSDDVVPGDIIKVRVELDRVVVGSWAQVQEEVSLWAKKCRAVLHQVQPIITGPTQQPPQKSKAASTTDETLLRNYGRYRSLPDKVVTFGLRLL